VHNPERNKANVIAFYELMFNACLPTEAVERFVGDEYIQHNPHVATGKEASLPISSAWLGSGRASEWR
jgi:predicted SnoaL-like aldol condensation-catalyzing enzyme